jgi:hypothetical protein
MNYCFTGLLFVFSFFIFSPLAAQSLLASREPSPEFSGTILRQSSMLSLKADSLSDAKAKLEKRLLPQNMSLWEKSMWGGSGLWRATNIAPLEPQVRQDELGIRRTMLTLHQIAGYATLVSMIGTAIYGQRVINGNFEVLDTHKAFATTTIVLYMTTGAMSLFSPPPLIRRDNWSTTSTHKLLALIHFTGILLTPFLARQVAKGNSAEDFDQRRRVHQISGYITTAAFASSIVVFAF